MHGNTNVLMSYIVSSERTSRLPACLFISLLRYPVSLIVA